MVWLRGGLGGIGGTNNIGLMVKSTIVRHFSRARAVNVRSINPKVPFTEAHSISQSLYQIVKQNGPLTVSNTWIHVKDANISGLKSKTHMKIMLKWMRGRKLLKLFCTHVGSNKKFLHCTLPEEPKTGESIDAPEENLQTQKPTVKRKKQKKQKK